MYGYQADEEIRKRAFLIAAGLSVLLAYFLHLIIENTKITIPWLIDVPGTLAFFGILIWIYDNHLWNRPPFTWLPWFYIPDLSGKWDVKIKSSYNGFEAPIKATAYIKQTAVKLSIILETDISRSHSILSSLVKIEGSSRYELLYHFINEQKAPSTETMNIHHGTSCVEFSDVTKMEGDYFSGRGRQNYGQITFIKYKK